MDTIRKAYISMLTESTDDSIKQLESDLKEKHPQLHSLSLYKSGDNVKLDTIIVKKEHRKSGVGSAVLDDIKQFADKNSKRVILTAGVKDKHWGTTSQSRLDQFYRRNGFVANKGRNKDYSISATHYYDGKSAVSESTEHPMIMLDGELRHMNNSDGKPIHPTMDGIYNFHRWFGKSKAVDEHGRPQVYYHGTGKDFDHFSHEYTGKGNDAHGSGFYFTTSPRTASQYSTSHVLPVYLKLTKPIDRSTEKTITRTHIEKMIRSAPEHIDSLNNFGDPRGNNYSRTLRAAVDAYSDSSKFDAMEMIHHDFYSSNHEKFLTNFKKITGHDGVDVRGQDIVTVFHPSQIKSAIGNDGTFDHPTKITETYHGEHSAPDPDTGAPAHNLTNNGIYPEDVYSGDAARMYGDGRADDASVIAELKSLRGRPKAQVKVYRAIPHEKSNSEKIEEFESHKRHIMRTGKIPSGVSGFTNRGKYYDRISDEIDRLKSIPEQSKEKIKINPGDWVTTNLRYAHEHGRDNLNNKYKVISKTVSASSIYTDSNSLHEFGYHPKNKLKEDTMDSYLPKDSAMAAYKQIVTEASNDEELSAIWKNTASQPWHEYMKTVKGVSHAIKQQQGEDSAENEASKKRVNDYLTKYKHLF